jgi:molybdopterin molybdotransferase
MLVRVNALEVLVYRRPRVRIIPTGTELTRVGAADSSSKVVESNSYMLQCLAARDGAEAIMHPIMRDDMNLLKSAIQTPGADVIVMTGGSSVGQEDLGPVVVREIGELPVHGVHMKPGSPTGIGFVNQTPIVLAPGYPVATLVAWDMFVRPIIQRLQNAPVRMPYDSTIATLAKPHRKLPVRMELQRVVLDSGIVTVLKGGAALLSTATRADGFVLFDAGRGEFSAGEEVVVHLYD